MAPPVGAAPPDRYQEVYSWDVSEVDEWLSAECGFTVVVSSKGQYRETYYYDRSGELLRVSAHPSYASVLTSEYGSLATADRGVDKYSFDADGNLLVHGTGIHLKVNGTAYSIGLWRLTFDEDGVVVSQEYHGNFGLEYPDLVPYLCEALGP
jgi:hypothetical protein